MKRKASKKQVNHQNLQTGQNQETKTFLIKIIVILALLFSGSLGFNDLFGGESKQDSQEVSQAVDQFNGENLEIFSPLTPISVAFVRVVDGDTAVFNLNGHQVKIRYLMVDTPETKAPAQPYAVEAKDRNQAILQEAKQIAIMFDKGSKEDKYDRLLAYVMVDGEDLGGILLSEGLGTVRYVVPPNNSKEADYRQIEEDARKAQMGIWSQED